MIRSEIDLQADGRHQGFLRLPHSVHRSAYGWIPIPIASIKNGDGPTVLLMAGNHGDEYEGQVTLCKMIKELDHEQIHGQIIFLPMANFPAARVGKRTSPIDQGNLNSSFPGEPDGTPTEMIAHFIETELLSHADFLLDIHSGGSSLLYIPSILMSIDPDPDKHAHNLAHLRSLELPQALLFASTNMSGYSSSAAARQNCRSMTLEIAGGGTIDRQALQRLHRGLYQYLSHIGIIDSSVIPDDLHFSGLSESSVETEIFTINPPQSYCYALEKGLFEPLVALGADVKSGQPAALIHDPETPWNAPAEVFFQIDGKVVCKRVPTRVERGHCLFEIGTYLKT